MADLVFDATADQATVPRIARPIDPATITGSVQVAGQRGERVGINDPFQGRP
jgi:hypothetical protein